MKIGCRVHVGGLLLAVAAMTSASVHAAPAVDFVYAGNYSLPVRSQVGARFVATMHQQHDFSCGAAAVATLLTYHYGTPTSEASAFEQMLATGDRNLIRKDGFSLLDIKRFLGEHGFQADGFELPLEKLVEARIPAIVLISDNGYNHFVVVKGLRDGRVLVGDPAAGTRVIDRATFERLWQNKLLFVIHNQQDLASFNSAVDWRLLPPAPLALGVARDTLATITIPRMGVGEH